MSAEAPGSAPARKPYLPAPEPAPSRLRIAGAIALGAALLCGLIPLTQFLTLLTVHAAAETATPVAWAVGLVFTLVLGTITLRQIASLRLVSRRTLVLVYGMLALAVPLANVGLVRQVFLTLHTGIREYLGEGTATYRTAYDALEPGWFPRLPSTEGLALVEADRMLRLLQRPEESRSRAAARRDLLLSLEPDGRPAPADAVDRLGPDEAAAVLAAAPPGSPLAAAVAARLAAASAASAAAAEGLADRLLVLGERALAELPSVEAASDLSSRRRLEVERARLDPAAAAELAARVQSARDQEDALRTAVTALSTADFGRVRAELAARRADQLRLAPPDRYAEQRSSLIYRLSREERRQFVLGEPAGSPDPSFELIRTSLWVEPGERLARDTAPLADNLGRVLRETPWSLWAGPLARWGLLCLVLFLGLLCLAEWLRRKWVERESLAFPLVEFADHLIRHDFRLELAADSRDPEPRRRPFYPLFWIGALVGAALLSIEALGHYGVIPGHGALVLDLHRSIFQHLGGAFRTLPPVVLGLSPLILGLGYLLSLQMSFSIWATFLLWLLGFWVFRLATVEIKDSSFTGFEGGRLYPFAMEQMLGAVLVLAVVALWQARRHLRRPPPRAAADAEQPPAPFLPHRLMLTGLAVLPLAAGWLLWDLGLRHLGFIAAFGLVCLAQAVALARVRAETGLPALPASYEFTKLAIILALPGAAGARIFAVFTTLAFLPATLLLRTLPQLLENIELARRHRLPYPAVAVAALVAFLVALPVGFTSLLGLTHLLGEAAYGATALAPQVRPAAQQLSTYSLWVAHFLGEAGLARFDTPNLLRLGWVGVGAGLAATLLLLRRRFLGFPLHPIGYVVVLLGCYFNWSTAFVPPEHLRWETNVWWASLFGAWLIKKLVVKYGGMNTYRRGKPLFIGCAAGAVLALFAWNLTHLIVGLAAQGGATGGLVRLFTERTPFSPGIL